MYISAYQEGLGARNRRTVVGLLIFVVILVIITAAFAFALVHRDERIDSISERIDSNDERIDSNQQIGYK